MGRRDSRGHWHGGAVARPPPRRPIVCCYGTTGPATIDPESGRPYGSHFPVVTVGDMVAFQKALISDWLNPAYQVNDVAAALREAGRSVVCETLPSDYGHDAFLLEHQAQDPIVRAFLDSAAKLPHNPVGPLPEEGPTRCRMPLVHPAGPSLSSELWSPSAS